MNTIKKLISVFNNKDIATKLGILFVFACILPLLVSILYHLIFNNPTITFGGF